MGVEKNISSFGVIVVKTRRAVPVFAKFSTSCPFFCLFKRKDKRKRRRPCSKILKIKRFKNPANKKTRSSFKINHFYFYIEETRFAQTVFVCQSGFFHRLTQEIGPLLFCYQSTEKPEGAVFICCVELKIIATFSFCHLKIKRVVY